ncbi:MAG: pyruvate kinase [Alphaproteobacteria bacterium]|nr:MAG: pyruvate kinase [Alphaproteobacteria bacterium]TAF75953.1 MAG: pyruvate kinase [Alphaproteobacteria bacterium]
MQDTQSNIATYERHCRIVATIGPASNPLELIHAGATCFRLNFSHGSHAEHAARIQMIRQAEEASGRFVPMIADLQGPKIRVGTFEGEGIQLRYGQEVTLEVSKEPGRDGLIRLPHPEILSALQVGDELKLDDGLMALTIISKESDVRAVARVDCGGYLTQKKGVNVPMRQLPISAMTEKDKKDLAFALEQGVEIVALSFVQRPEDVAEARALVQGRALILSKIEKPLAMDSIDEIVALSDMVMVARGDLGVELPTEQVPAAQRKIVRACRAAGKPVIIATQMLQTMVDSPVPTRAEASDVATAVYMGADAVMLSAESAVGRHPATAVATMDRIIRAVEADEFYWDELDAAHGEWIGTPAHALCASASDIAEVLEARAIFAFTASGTTAVAASRERPRTPLYALTPHKSVARQLTMVWGVTPILSPNINETAEFRSSDDMLAWAERLAQNTLNYRAGEHVVMLAGTPFGVAGSTNTLKIVTLAG